MNGYEDVERPGHTRKRRNRDCILTAIILSSLVLLLIVIIILVIVWWPKPEVSYIGYYYKAAVATDSAECSAVGKDVLKRNGSAADAAIASLFCVGVRNLQGCGIGGGFFMIINDIPRNTQTREMVTFNAREVAPLHSSKDMFPDRASSTIGGLSIAVPGEIKGLYDVWQMYGRLPWADLIAPTVAICKDGFRIGPALADAISIMPDLIRTSEGLRELFMNKDGSFKSEGDTIQLPKLAKTLERIADDPNGFYDGDLAKDVLEDIREAGGIMVESDLANYKVVRKAPHSFKLRHSNFTIFTLPAPSSGPLLTFMLDILDGFEFSNNDVDDIENSALTYHRIVETLKFGYAMKTYLGDEDFDDLTEVLANLSSPAFVDDVRSRITPNQTHPISYYNPQPGEHKIEDGGTCHLNVISPDGGAVSATSTINLRFGSGVVGRRTGIFFNNEMDDFTIPMDGKTTYGQGNFIVPGKRPLSSMVPTIIFNEENKTWLVLGGSGGTRITSAMLYTLVHRLWLSYNIYDAIDKARLHHQLIPNDLQYEAGFSEKVVELLKQRGHNIYVRPPKSTLSAIQAVESTCEHRTRGHNSASKGKCLVGVSDYRKGGRPDGF